MEQIIIFLNKYNSIYYPIVFGFIGLSLFSIYVVNVYMVYLTLYKSDVISKNGLVADKYIYLPATTTRTLSLTTYIGIATTVSLAYITTVIPNTGILIPLLIYNFVETLKSFNRQYIGVVKSIKEIESPIKLCLTERLVLLDRDFNNIELESIKYILDFNKNSREYIVIIKSVVVSSKVTREVIHYDLSDSPLLIKYIDGQIGIRSI